MLDLVWLVPFLPGLGALFNAFNRNRKVAGPLAATMVGLAFVLSLGVFFALPGYPAQQHLFERAFYTWMKVGDLQVDIGFQIDPLATLMMLVVTGVGFLIHVYSIGYMHDDPRNIRYFSYLNLFTFAMLLLVMANNYAFLFVGWEGVGLCSYLLIGFWFERESAARAGMKAFIINRIGDLGFILGVLLIFITFGSLDFTEVFAAAPERLVVGGGVVTAITLLLFVGAIGKSAQLPLYVWLPDAMEGPTPVSALIHAATMVTAGVYMVARSSVLYQMAPEVMTLVAVIGAVTALFAASIGLAQRDIKRVLAYSTVSQLGYMFLALGVGAFSAGLFHLTTHAFFKSLLFLGAGSVIHALHGQQDMRQMGGLRQHLPITYTTMVVAALAIAGIVPFAGFFSKDAILWHTFASGHILLWGIGSTAALLTAFYMFRLVFLTFHGTLRADAKTAAGVHESPAVMTRPLLILGALCLVGGGMGIPLLEGWDFIDHYLAPVFAPAKQMVPSVEFHSIGLELFTMVFSLVVAGAGIGLAHQFYVKNPALPEQLTQRLRAFYTLLFNKYYVDEAYGMLVVVPFMGICWFLWHVFDVIFIDGLVNGVGRLMRAASEVLRRMQSGVVQNYALGVLLGAVVILVYTLFW